MNQWKNIASGIGLSLEAALAGTGCSANEGADEDIAAEPGAAANVAQVQDRQDVSDVGSGPMNSEVIGATEEAATDLTNGLYTIRPKHIRDLTQCLDVERGSFDAGAPIVQWKCKNRTNQLFSFRKFRKFYEIVAYHDRLCLQVKGGSKSNGAPIVQGECQGNHNQQFEITSDGHIKARHSKKCLDVQGGSDSQGARLIQYDCKPGKKWQQFKIKLHSFN